jgi:predicted nucleic acid-binding protein
MSSPPVVVLDTNTLWDDVEAIHGKLRVVLDGTRRDDFELVVPTVVIDELTRQYPRRVKRIRKALRAAVSDQNDEIRRLSLDPPVEYSAAGDAIAYRQRITTTLEDAGARLIDAPDVSPALPWAIARRKPFKQSGEGLPDAAIWLTVIAVAETVAPRPVLFVSSNTKDFGNGRMPVELADECRQDLQDRGLSKHAVQLIPSLQRFIDLVAKPFSAADHRATRRLESGVTRSAIATALERRLDFGSVPEGVADLGIPLLADPTIITYDVDDDFELRQAAAVDEDTLRISLFAAASVSVEVVVPREIAYVEGDRLRGTIVDDDYSDQAVEVGADLRLRLTAEVLLPLAEAEEEDVEVTDLRFSLAPEELVDRALTDDLVEVVRGLLNTSRNAPEVEDYLPDELVYSDLQEASLGEIRAISIRDVVVDDQLNADEYVIRLEIDAEADVDWHATLTDARDASEHPADDEDAGYLRQGGDFASPIALEVSAILHLPDEVRDVEIVRAVLQAEERQARQEYLDRHDPENERLARLAEEMEE